MSTIVIPPLPNNGAQGRVVGWMMSEYCGDALSPVPIYAGEIIYPSLFFVLSLTTTTTSKQQHLRIIQTMIHELDDLQCAN
jgi:hypothetical protein